MDKALQSMRKIYMVLFLFFCVSEAYAAHPLITDDTGTQGKGKLQVEVNSEFTSDKETEDGVVTKETGGEVATILSYGLIDNADIVIGLPYQWHKVKVDGVVDPEDPAAKTDGISDMSLEVKWRFYEKDGLSLGLKPGITLPTGNENKGLGNGKASYSLMFITTKEMEPFAFHLNLGYARNDYKLEADKEANRKRIWQASLASEVEVIKDLKAVANIGIERNPDKTSNTHPAFILGGVIYSITEKFDIDFGIKRGLNKPETDYSVLAGITRRF